MTDVFSQIKRQLSGKRKTIILPEGTDLRIMEAAVRLQTEGFVKPVLLGNQEEIAALSAQYGTDITGVEIIDPVTYPGTDLLIEKFIERRNGKADLATAIEAMQDVNTFGTMLVYTGAADGLVSGAAHSTADTVRPALQIIKTKPGITKTSGAFIMIRGDERYVFADCAITVSPTDRELAEIAVESAKTAVAFGIDPRVAMLSFSTKGSAVTEETEKVASAVRIVKEMAPDLIAEGELQFDSAYVPEVAATKAPDSAIQGDATVFVFPTLEAGNIGYKITQRLGNFEAVGPVLQGLNAPVNDLSRGCSAEDVYKLALITAAQSLQTAE